MNRPNVSRSPAPNSGDLTASSTGQAEEMRQRVEEYQRKQHAVKGWIEMMLGVQIESEDLWKPLRNGVVLGFLIKQLDDELMPRINVDAADFKYKENIEFVTGAMVELEMKPFMVFKTSDLWDRGNMVNVIECLYQLAKLVQAEFDGAPELVLDAKWPLPAVSAEERREIEAGLRRVRTKPPSGARPKIAPMIMKRKLQLLAGNGVDINKLIPAFVKFQALVRGYLQRKEYKKMVRSQAHRDHVAREILSTERNYVQALSCVCEVWMAPLDERERQGKGLISREQIQAIFSEIQTISILHTQLFAEIEARVNAWNPRQCMGDIFLRIAEYLKSYGPFVQNFNNSMKVLDLVQRKKDVCAYLEACKAHPRSMKLDLPSLLIMPIQRIPRYNLLLSDLKKHTWPTHPDFDNLNKAVEKIESIATDINEKKRQAENMQRLLELNNRLVMKASNFTLPEPHRRLHLEATFFAGTKQEVVVVLLSDMLLICAPDKKNLKLRDHFQIALVDAVDPGPSADPLALDFVKVGSNKPVLRVLTASAKEKAAWLTEMLRVRSNDKEGRQKKRILMAPRTAGASGGTTVTAEQQLRRRLVSDSALIGAAGLTIGGGKSDSTTWTTGAVGGGGGAASSSSSMAATGSGHVHSSTLVGDTSSAGGVRARLSELQGRADGKRRTLLDNGKKLGKKEREALEAEVQALDDECDRLAVQLAELEVDDQSKMMKRRSTLSQPGKIDPRAAHRRSGDPAAAPTPALAAGGNVNASARVRTLTLQDRDKPRNSSLPTIHVQSSGASSLAQNSSLPTASAGSSPRSAATASSALSDSPAASDSESPGPISKEERKRLEKARKEEEKRRKQEEKDKKKK